MKKLLFAIFCVATLSSCYNTRVLVGDVQPKEPLVKVNSEMNSHWLFCVRRDISGYHLCAPVE